MKDLDPAIKITNLKNVQLVAETQLGNWLSIGEQSLDSRGGGHPIKKWGDLPYFWQQHFFVCFYDPFLT